MLEGLFNKIDLHDPDNQNGVITHLEPDILECEVKWALREDGGVSRVSSSCGARGGFLPRHDEDLSPAIYLVSLLDGGPSVSHCE